MKVGLIDSGINLRNNIIHGCKFEYTDYTDYINHGTTCAKIIHGISPEIEIYNIKVFNKKLVTSSKKIIKAIEWCIKNNIRIINLSISINDVNYYYEFKQVCDSAFEKGIIIIASADNLGRPCLPAYLDNVLGVGIADLSSDNDFIFSEDSEIQLYTRGDLLGKDKTLNKNHSTSHATAHMTGIITNILSDNPKISFSELKALLKLKAIEYQSNKILRQNQSFNFIKNTKPIKLNTNDNTIQNLGKVAFLGTEIEANLFRKHETSLKFEIHELIELKFNSEIDFRNINNSNKNQALILPSCFETSLSGCKSLIIGSLSGELYFQARKIAEKLKKNIYSLYPIKNDIINQGKNETNNIYLLQVDPRIRLNELIIISPQHITNNQVPILGIINLCQNQELFNVEIIIKKELEANNFKVGQISSDPKANLFGFDYSFSDFKQIPNNLQSAYAKALVESVNNKKPDADILLVGIDEAIVPLTSNNSDFFGHNSSLSISMLFGFQPDAVIIVIDEIVEFDYLIRSINCIESLFNTEVLLVINNSLFKNDETNKIQITNFDKILQTSKLKMDNLASELQKSKNLSIFELNEHANSIVGIIKKQFQLQKNNGK